MKYNRIFTAVSAIIGGALGFYTLPLLWATLPTVLPVPKLLIPVINVIVGALILTVISYFIREPVRRITDQFVKRVMSLSLPQVLIGSVGIIIGLLIAWLVSLPITALGIPVISNILPSLISVLLGYTGFSVASKNRDEIRKLFNRPKNDFQENAVLERKFDENFYRNKVLDTSVIIDGRINDILRTGFIEGTIVVPQFVLKELQYIADSSDSLKRVRGRRGLDILNEMQKIESTKVEFYDGDFEDVEEVDLKLIRLAKLIDGMVVTNDYNLNKVCEFQNVPVLNINALANAVKPVVIPGENMIVNIVKNGTERQQGVGYLDDGTMIVVEDGQYFMNETIEVVVTSALQTAAGRMIFAKPVHSQRGIKEKNS